MDRIPYELLQQISSCLLPRYQCRLAITSRHCYRYLYNDLLRWHARAAPIEVPKYALQKNAFNVTSVIISKGRILTSYISRSATGDWIEISNYATCKTTTISNLVDNYDITSGMLYVHTSKLYTGILYDRIKGEQLRYNEIYCKYIKYRSIMHVDVLLALTNMAQPIWILDRKIWPRIYYYLDRNDIINFRHCHYWLHCNTSSISG